MKCVEHTNKFGTFSRGNLSVNEVEDILALSRSSLHYNSQIPVLSLQSTVDNIYLAEFQLDL